MLTTARYLPFIEGINTRKEDYSPGRGKVNKVTTAVQLRLTTAFYWLSSII